jgi:methionyl-tRNA formyltransferase
MKKILIITGSDTISSRFVYELKLHNFENIEIVMDCSGSFKRVFRLIIKKRLKFKALVNIIFADLRRKRYKFSSNLHIKSNKDLLNLIYYSTPKLILCFRAGLIINKEVIDTKIPIYNVHASNLPDLPGLGTIQKSLDMKAYKQNACLHIIDEGIDTGNIVLKRSYELNPIKSYFENENIAYGAGIKLAISFLMQYC